MKALNWDGQEVELNEKEQSVYNCIAAGDEFNDRPSMHPSDIGVDGLTKNQIKGYLSQLDQKHVITEMELPSGEHCWGTMATYEELEGGAA